MTEAQQNPVLTYTWIRYKIDELHRKKQDVADGESLVRTFARFNQIEIDNIEIELDLINKGVKAMSIRELDLTTFASKDGGKVYNITPGSETRWATFTLTQNGVTGEPNSVEHLPEPHRKACEILFNRFGSIEALMTDIQTLITFKTERNGDLAELLEHMVERHGAMIAGDEPVQMETQPQDPAEAEQSMRQFMALLHMTDIQGFAVPGL